MSTYAVYWLWAGIKLEEDDEGQEHPFIDEIVNSWDPVKKAGLDFVQIHMHGRTVGVGVKVIEDLDWTDEIDEMNLYDPNTSNNAINTLEQVKKVFAELGITCDAKLYHHLDLGG